MSKLGDEWIVFDQQNQKLEVNLEHDQKFEIIDERIAYIVKYVKQLNDQLKETAQKESEQRANQEAETYQQLALIKNDMVNINNNITFLLNKIDQFESKMEALSNVYAEISKKKTIYVHK